MSAATVPPGKSARGTLYLVPNLLGVVAPEAVLPQRTLDIARRLTRWVVETPKSARAFLKSLAGVHPIAQLQLTSLSRGNAGAEVAGALAFLLDGRDVGLLSDAGCPGIADPGAPLVAAAHERGVRVVPLVGPSAILLALMASGMNGQRFCFHGYLPVKPDARVQALQGLERESRANDRTQLFIEAPYRNAGLLRALSEALAPRTRVCVAADLTLATETIECRRSIEWRRQDHVRFDRRPAMFLLHA